MMLDANGKKRWEFGSCGLHEFARRLRPQSHATVDDLDRVLTSVFADEPDVAARIRDVLAPFFGGTVVRPQVEAEIAPKPEDIAVESFPAAPAGGMSVGMPAGMKVTHKPTGCTAAVSHYRSQHLNRAAALRALTAALNPEMP